MCVNLGFLIINLIDQLNGQINKILFDTMK